MFARFGLARVARATSTRWILAALMVSASSGPVRAQTAPSSRPSSKAASEQAPAALTLAAAVRAALAHNPGLNEARFRKRADEEQAPALARLPDPELEYQLWAQPLARPWALDEAQMHMLGVRQAFPAPGTLSNRSAAAASRAATAEHNYQASRLALVAQVRRAFAAYYIADREYRLHLEHGRLEQQIIELARASYRAGRGTQQDVLRAELALSRLHTDLARVEADRSTAKGLLNTLMGKPPAAPLGPPADLGPQLPELKLASVESADRRPELQALTSSIEAEQKELAATRAAGKWPSFMLGAQYMFMPMEMERHRFGLMVSMSLPWFNPRYGEETRAAEARVSAERSALEQARLTADYELYAAAQRYQAARRTFETLDTALVPQATRNFEAAQAAYRGTQLDTLALLDALRALLDLRIERERALAGVALAAADVARARGTLDDSFQPVSP